MLYLPEEESFSLSANVEAPGPQRMALRGYLVRQTRNGTYIAPLLPQMFYGVDGNQLTSWRQNLPAAGNQVILSRAPGGLPKVPDQDIFWRKVSEPARPAAPCPTCPGQAQPQMPLPPFSPWNPWIPLLILFGATIYYAQRGR